MEKGEAMRIEIIIDHYGKNIEQRSFIVEACEVKDDDKYFQLTDFNGIKRHYPKSSYRYRNLDIRRSE